MAQEQAGESTILYTGRTSKVPVEWQDDVCAEKMKRSGSAGDDEVAPN